MARETPKEMLRRYLEALSSGDVVALDHILSEQVDFAAPGLCSRELAGVKAWHRRFSDAFPDAEARVVRQLVGGGTVVTEVVYTATQDSPLVLDRLTIPASHRRVELAMCMVSRVESDLVTAHHIYFDQLAMIVQLGSLAAVAAG